MMRESFKIYYVAVIITMTIYLLSVNNSSIMQILSGGLLLAHFPGVLILYILRVKKISLAKYIIFSSAFSIVFVTAIGFLSNSFVFLHISTNMFSINTLLLSYVILFIVLLIVNRGRWDACIDIEYEEDNFSFLLFVLLIAYTVLCSVFNISLGLFILPIIVSSIIILTLLQKKVNYALVIYTLALSLLLQTTLLSSNLLGSDIVLEYWTHAKLLQNGYWDLSMPSIYHSALSIVFVTPIYEIITGIDGICVFKIIVPIFYAMTPVALFFLYKKFFNAKISFIAAILYVLIPVYFLEMPSVVREQISMLVLSTALYCMLSKNEFTRIRLGRFFIPFLLLISVSILYYGLGIISVLFLSIILVITIIHRIIKIPIMKIRNNWISLKYTIVILVGLVLITGIYYSLTSDGVTIKSLVIMIKSQFSQFVRGVNETYVYPWSILVSEWTNISDNLSVGNANVWSIMTDFSNRPSLISTGLGLDLMKVSIEGKIYRILTMMLNMSIIGGIIYGIMHLKRFSSAYISIVVSSVIVAGMYLILPIVSYYMGATRIYHLLIIVFAPIMVIFWRFVMMKIFNIRKNYLLVPSIMVVIPFFIFSSGMVFEVLKYDDMNRLDIPFSQTISGYRLDMGLDLTEKDRVGIDIVKDIISNENNVVFMDLYSKMLVTQKVIWEKNFDWDYKTPLIYIEDMSNIDSSYIFFRERNIKDNTFIIPSGYGLRDTVELKDEKSELLKDRTVIYDDGCRIYSPKS